MTKIFFPSKDGVRLCGVWHKPAITTSKAIVLAHGVTVDKDEDGIFTDLANLLMAKGFAVFRFDFRGHGESDTKSIDLTISGEILDIAAAVDLVKQEYSTVGLLGASFGGGSSALYAADHFDQLKCLCLWNPVLDYDHFFMHPTTAWIQGQIDQMMNDYDEKGWTTLGSSKFVIGNKLLDDMKQYKPYEKLRKITIPTLILHGDIDTYVSYADSQEFVSNLPNGELITIKGAEHGFHEPWESDLADRATLKFFMENM